MKFGITTKAGFDARMTRYNARPYYEKLLSRAFKDQILVKAGTTIHNRRT
jgi:hypothetical protein